MAKTAEQVGAIFVHVSTDYVFDGSKEFLLKRTRQTRLGFTDSQSWKGSAWPKIIRQSFI